MSKIKEIAQAVETGKVKLVEGLVQEAIDAGDDPNAMPEMRWRGHSCLLFANWINYIVYADTPYDLRRLG